MRSSALYWDKVKRHEATENHFKTLVTLISQAITTVSTKVKTHTASEHEVQAVVDLVSQTLTDVGDYAQVCRNGSVTLDPSERARDGAPRIEHGMARQRSSWICRSSEIDTCRLAKGQCDVTCKKTPLQRGTPTHKYEG